MFCKLRLLLDDERPTICASLFIWYSTLRIHCSFNRGPGTVKQNR